jgi:predicted transcriptional regulator
MDPAKYVAYLQEMFDEGSFKRMNIYSNIPMLRSIARRVLDDLLEEGVLMGCSREPRHLVITKKGEEVVNGYKAMKVLEDL